MSDKERIAWLQAENAELRTAVATAHETITVLTAQVAALVAQNSVLVERIAVLEKQGGTNSRNSSKPPSSDGPVRLPKSLRHPSGKKAGGQPDHPGASLRLVERPDAVVVVQPLVCGTCQGSLGDGVIVGRERRQVIDVPPVRPVVREYHGVRVCCAACGATTTGAFPVGVRAPVQYGPRVRAIAVYLTQQQLLPYGRTREVLTDLRGCPITEGTLATLVQEAAARLAPVEDAIADGTADGSTPAQRRNRALGGGETVVAAQCLDRPLDPLRGPSQTRDRGDQRPGHLARLWRHEHP